MMYVFELSAERESKIPDLRTYTPVGLRIGPYFATVHAYAYLLLYFVFSILEYLLCIKNKFAFGTAMRCNADICWKNCN